jgi:hypothetical protein
MRFRPGGFQRISEAAVDVKQGSFVGITAMPQPIGYRSPHGVRDAGGISLGGCQPNRVQAKMGRAELGGD